MKEVEVLPENTSSYCLSGKYRECPFYLIMSDAKNVCPNVRKCPAFRNFQFFDLDKFVGITSKYCTSSRHDACRRFILKSSGAEVPVNLHPDGSIVREWK
jgi:hypothetical protein